jgi:eukaryotic-like serine/threonine-protein kinase
MSHRRINLRLLVPLSRRREPPREPCGITGLFVGFSPATRVSMTNQEPFYPTLRPALAGRFQIETFLGRGGMGLVYLARELRLDRLVALKVLAPEHAAFTERQQRFLREARIAAALVHPNIVPIFSVEEEGEVVFFSMAFVEGETLDARIRRAGPLPPLEAIRLVGVVAEALATAHAHDVVHLDVKPDNILLESRTGRVLLSDFGIAEVSPSAVGDGEGIDGRRVMGTLGFMSPEQARGERVDFRSDLYSLGVVAYYAMSGRLPFEADTEDLLLAHQRAGAVVPLARVAPHVPRRLAQLVDRCLAPHRDARFQDGLALAHAAAFALQALEDPPLAIRAFQIRSRHLSWSARLYAGLWGLAALPVAAWFWLHGPDLLTRIAAAAGLGLLVLPPLFVLVIRVRRLVSLGHELEELREALRVEWARRREELAFAYGAGPSRFEQWLRRLTYGALAGSAALTLLPAVPALPIAVAASSGVTLLAALVARARYEQRTEPLGARRIRFWEGPLGRLVFRLAGFRSDRPFSAAAVFTVPEARGVTPA